MKMNIFLKGAALSIAAGAALAASAEPYDYTAKAINAYDHNGKLISSHIAPDVQYIEIEDRSLSPETYTVTGENGSAQFTMIPVVGTNNYAIRTGGLAWSQSEKSNIVKTFLIGQTEVTNALWKAVMGTVPSNPNNGDNFPVTNITWNEVCRPGGFLDKLNEMVANDPKMKQLMKGRVFSLPTEWEWEYAAGEGVLRSKTKYSGSNSIDEVGWYISNSDGTAHEVAKKKPNGLGIYDMTGNVWEMCIENQYKLANTDFEDNKCTVRGLAFVSNPDEFSNPARTSMFASEALNKVGFRLIIKENNLEPEYFSITGEDGSTARFTMLPVAGPSNYRLKSEDILWEDTERRSEIKTFHIGETEVTNALWKAVMGSIPADQTNSGDNFPVSNTSWNEICKTGGFLDRLNNIAQNDPLLKEQLKGRKFYLPTEWEWEYAANGGYFGDSYIYSGSDTVDDVAWHKANSGNLTHEVAQKKPNSLGIYDMTGNVWEWCSENKYKDNDGTYLNGSRPMRGGAYGSSDYLPLISRNKQSASISQINVGLRLILK